MLKIALDSSLSGAKRAQVQRAAAELWSTPVLFHGDAVDGEAEATFAVPLHDVRTRYSVAVSLAAGPGEAARSSPPFRPLPGAHSDGASAGDPSGEERSRERHRALVGVLETTTQISTAASPEWATTSTRSRACAVARLPGALARPAVDDALDVEQKRCIVKNAARLAGAAPPASRRCSSAWSAAGPEGFASSTGRWTTVSPVSAGASPRAALPAILAASRTAARLGVQATLDDAAALPGESQDDGTSRFLGRSAWTWPRARLSGRRWQRGSRGW
jgi:hypothetical protein